MFLYHWARRRWRANLRLKDYFHKKVLNADLSKRYEDREKLSKIDLQNIAEVKKKAIPENQ